MDPEEKKGKARSHVGYNFQGVQVKKTSGDGAGAKLVRYDEPNQLEKYSAEVELTSLVEQAEREVVTIPPQMQADIRMLVTGLGDVPTEMKGEAHLRKDQAKLRHALDGINNLINTILEKEIQEEQVHQQQLAQKKKVERRQQSRKGFRIPTEKAHEILTSQLANAKQTLESLEQTKVELQRKLAKMEVQPNRREILEANIRRLVREIRLMEVDKNKFEIIEKQYKKVTYLQSDIDTEKRIISMENLLQATLDKIKDIEDEKSKYPGGLDPIQTKTAQIKHNIEETLKKAQKLDAVIKVLEDRERAAEEKAEADYAKWGSLGMAPRVRTPSPDAEQIAKQYAINEKKIGKLNVLLTHLHRDCQRLEALTVEKRKEINAIETVSEIKTKQFYNSQLRICKQMQESKLRLQDLNQEICRQFVLLNEMSRNQVITMRYDIKNKINLALSSIPVPEPIAREQEKRRRKPTSTTT